MANKLTFYDATQTYKTDISIPTPVANTTVTMPSSGTVATREATETYTGNKYFYGFTALGDNLERGYCFGSNTDRSNYGGTNKAAIELGLSNNMPFLDFHCSDTWVDYNARIIVGGNTAGIAAGLMTIQAGGVYISGGPLGYGTGSGGTVTQATSKSTAVTLNKPTGQITMNNAALAAGGLVQFFLNSSLIGINDTLVVNATNNGNYRVEVAAILSGQCLLRVTNVTGGSLSEALVIQYSIIKGATS